MARRSEILKKSLQGDLIFRDVVLIAVLLAIVGVFGLFGGFDAAAEYEVTSIGPGDSVSTDQLEVVVGQKRGEMLVLTLTNTSHIPIFDFISTRCSHGSRKTNVIWWRRCEMDSLW